MNLKRYSIIGLGVFVLLAGLLEAQVPLERPLAEFDKLISNLKVAAMVGEPVRVGETYVVPFAKIHFGLGGGGAMMAYGGGMGGKTIPLGILIIEGEDVRVELFPEEEKKPSLLQELLPVLLKMLPQIMGDKSPFASKPPAAAGKASGQPAEIPKDASLEKLKKSFSEKKYHEALAMADALLAKDPDNADLHAWKGHAMGSLAQGNPADMMKYGMGAMQEYETALKLDPGNADGHFGRGMVRLMAPPGFGGDLDGAIEDFEAAVAKDPLPEAYFNLGEAYRKKGDLEKAKAAYKKALVIRPNYSEAAKALAGLQ
ncbi:MAG TPA: spore germination protein GerW family protein [Candidatus Desulfaltia sp.]|nr:spore germination protein GerW family protein [Candidatus Desulfaltia sp.]